MKKLFQESQQESSDVIKDFLKSIVGDFNEVYDEVYKKILGKIDVKDGQVQYNDNLVNLIREYVIQATIKTNYKANVLKFVDNSKGVAGKDITINKELGNKVASSVTNKLLGNTGIFYEGLTAGGYEVNVVNRVQSLIYNSLKNNVSVLELKANLEKYFDATDDTGDLYKYTKQVAQDSLYQYTGELNAGIYDELGLNGIIYTPNILIERSRPICTKIIDTYKAEISNEELLLLLNKADKDPKGFGQGMIVPTKTVSEFIRNRGGYNCIHKAYGTLI
jgi:hypothetical protein